MELVNCSVGMPDIDSFEDYNVNQDPDFQQYAGMLQKNLEQAKKLTQQAGQQNANAFVSMLGGRARSGSARSGTPKA